MDANPLAPPAPDSAALRLFLEHFRLQARGSPPEALLEGVAGAFSRIPYENLTKILKFAEAGAAERARRGPLEVVSDHARLGAGGTCFSLTAALLHVLRALGFEAEPILADRRYGPDTHCALIVQLGGAPHLIDPGFLIVRPIALEGAAEARIASSFNELLLVPRDGGERLDLHTVQHGSRTYRLSYRTAPVDAGEFLNAWDRSFEWEMMRYPVLTRVIDGRQLYIQDRRVQLRTQEGAVRREVDVDELLRRIALDFGIDGTLAARALEVLVRQGELRGPRALSSP
jgi:arylamine N-acetyltransferase